MEDQDLLRDEVDGPEPHVLPAAGHVAQVLERRRSRARTCQTRLGRKTSQGQRPRPATARACAGASSPATDSRAAATDRPKKHRGVLVHQAQAGQQPEDEPQPPVAALHDADERPRASHPEEGLEGVHREDAVGAQVDGRGDDGQAGQGLRKAPASQLAGPGPS